MIRINLLPIKQDRRREAARNQILIAVGVILIEITVFLALNLGVRAEIDVQKNLNSTVRAEVNRIKNQIKDHKEILDEVAEFEKRQASIEGLQEARTGPVYVMLELSTILSKAGRPNIDNVRYQELIRLDPTAGFDEDWDFRRLWISNFSEKNRTVEIRGQALSHEDVAEFLRRINLSRFFVSSELVSTQLTRVKLDPSFAKLDAMDPAVDFYIKGKVRYR